MIRFFLLTIFVCLSVNVTAQSSCEPVSPEVRTQGFWKRVTQRRHPSGEHRNIRNYVNCVNTTATFSQVTCARDIRNELHFRPRNSKRQQAEAQFMALLLNYCSGRVELCNCVEDPDLGSVTVGEVIAVIDDILSSPQSRRADYVFAQALADRINNNETLVSCPQPPPAPLPQLPPESQDDFYTTDWDTPLVVDAPGILANDSDPNGDVLEAHLNGYPNSGWMQFNNDGSFTYYPSQGFEGQVSFEYKAWDGVDYSISTVYIDIVAGNQAPVTEDDYFTVQAGTRLVVDAPGVLANDYDPEGSSLISYGTTDVPEVGTLGFNQDGSFWYDAPAGYTGTVTFVYKAGDGVAKTDATVTIDIVP